MDDGVISLRNTETGATTTLTNGGGRVEMLALSPDARFLVATEHNQKLRWWDLRNHTNTLLEAEASQALFSPDGHTLALLPRNDFFQSRNETNIVQLWDIATLSLKASLVMEQPFRFAAAFSPDGRILALPAQDDAIYLWDTTNGKLLGACAGHKQPIFSITFSADGRTLASASDDSTLKFWNVEARQELLSFRRLGGSLSGLLFSPDGRMLVGASGPFVRPPVLRFFRAPLLQEIEALSSQKPSG
jgi:WD40 repeat protein